MIVLDIETSGLYPSKCGIWQIGALDFYNPSNEFLEEGRIDDEDIIQEGALKVTGKTESELRNCGLQSQKNLLESFFKWTNNASMKNCACENPQFDLGFIGTKAIKYELKLPFAHRAFDLHSVAQTKYLQIHGRLLTKDNKSNLSLTNILKFCGIEDKRQEHNALEDVQLEAECFSRLWYGIGLLREYSHYPVPDYLERRVK